jgi:hypothetical protein
MPTVDDLNKNIIGETNITDDDAKRRKYNRQPMQNKARGNAAAQPAATKTNETPLFRAQEMPEYPGAINALKKIHAEKFTAA